MKKEGFAVLSREDLDKVEAIKDGLLSFGGEQIVLYIYQPRDGIDRIRAGKGPKFHLVDCKKLREMREWGRFDRYVVHARPEKLFPVIPANARGGKEEREKLLPCKYCLGQLGYSRSDRSVRDFSRTDFFGRCRERGYFPKMFMPKYADRHSQPVGGYSRDWGRRSREVREAAGWTCARCGVNCASHRKLLHAHHKNGLLADCGEDNLQALCVVCHSRQPLHHRLQVKKEDRETVLSLRREQGVDFADDDRGRFATMVGGRRATVRGGAGYRRYSSIRLR